MPEHDSTTSADQAEFTWTDESSVIEETPTYTQAEVTAMVTTWNDQAHEMRDIIAQLRTDEALRAAESRDALAALDTAHRARIDRLMSVAGRRADENSLCHVFEQTLIECGEPFDGFFDRVTMDITFTVTVTQDVLADRRARRHDLDYMQRADVQSVYYAEHMIRSAMRNVSGEYGYAPILDSSDYAPVNHVFPTFVDVSGTSIDVVSTEAINGHQAGDSRYRDSYGDDNSDNDDSDY